MEVIRLKEKFEDFKKAYNRLTEGLRMENTSSIIMDGTIQRFELAFELSWKLMKAYLEYQGFEEAKSPRTTIRLSYQNSIINDGDGWIDMMIDRNRTTHIYDESQAKEIYDKIKEKHYPRIKELKEYFEKNII
ncbi:MAG: nucleotidyltransferase substrate binding protein [Halanaerobiales bacterium]